MDEFKQEIDHVIKVFFLLLNFMGEDQFKSDDKTGHMEIENFMPELFKRLAESSSKFLTFKHPKLKEVLPQAILLDCINKKLKKQTIETTKNDPFEKIATNYRNSPDMIGDFYKQLHSVCNEYLSEKDNRTEFKYRCSRYKISESEDNLEEDQVEDASQKKPEKKHRNPAPEKITRKKKHQKPDPQPPIASSPQPAQVNLTISVLPSEPAPQHAEVPRPVTAEPTAPTPQSAPVQHPPLTPPLETVLQPAPAQQPVTAAPPGPPPQPIVVQQPAAAPPLVLVFQTPPSQQPVTASPPVPTPKPVPLEQPAPKPQPVPVQPPPSISPSEPVPQPAPFEQPAPAPASTPVPAAQAVPAQLPSSIPSLAPVVQPAQVQPPVPATPTASASPAPLP